jgi:predicted transcriptional regulator
VTAEPAQGPLDGSAEHEQNVDDLRTFIERFTSVLIEAGVPRMPARVFAALLASDRPRLTAAELADLLQASPAAISGGVRYLIGVGMCAREGEPGSSRHYYRTPQNVWDEVMASQTRVLARWAAVLQDGIEVLGPDTPGGARMADSVEYFDFVITEMPRMTARWQERRAE